MFTSLTRRGMETGYLRLLEFVARGYEEAYSSISIAKRNYRVLENMTKRGQRVSAALLSEGVTLRILV